MHDNPMHTCQAPLNTRHPSPSSFPPTYTPPATTSSQSPTAQTNTPPENLLFLSPDQFPTVRSHMAEHYQQHQHQQGQPRSHMVVKAATAVTAGGSLLVLSGLTLAGTVVALALATPLMVIFSPVLVPATITVCLLLTGFVASGGFGAAGLTVFTWMYRYMTGQKPPGAEQLEQARSKLAGKAREMKDRAEQFGQHQTGS